MDGVCAFFILVCFKALRFYIMVFLVLALYHSLLAYETKFYIVRCGDIYVIHNWLNNNFPLVIFGTKTQINTHQRDWVYFDIQVYYEVWVN